MAFLAFVHLALYLALSLSPGNSLVSSLCDHSMAALKRHCVQLHSHMLRLITACLRSVGVCIRDLRISRLRLNGIRIESGVTIRIRIESRIESAIYMTFHELGLLKLGVRFGW